MIGSIFKRDIMLATGRSWEEWVMLLQGEVQSSWTHEQTKSHIRDRYGVEENWCEWIANLFLQLLGRNPVGVTKDAGVQIGVRKTWVVNKEQAWKLLVSPEGLRLWLGNLSSVQLEKGMEFESEEGISGKITVLKPCQKIRTTWKRKDWEQYSRLQIYVLATNSGKTTIAIHQERLEDIYLREMMRRHWEDMLFKLNAFIEESGQT